MVDHFEPSGRVLEPFRGSGVFTSLLPSADWCEIDDGRDFFHCSQAYDWIISNPPYSLTRKCFRHAALLADNIVFLIPLRNLFSGFGFVKEVFQFGGIAEIRVYGTGGRVGFPMGNCIGAVYMRRDHSGPTTWTFYPEAP
jgi:hypothetical protein